MATTPMPVRDDSAGPQDLSGVQPATFQPPGGAAPAAADSGRVGATRMIRQLMTQIDALASQFPEAAEAAKAASKALVDTMVAITRNQADQGKSAAPPNR